MLNEELYGCFKHIGINYDTLLKMPTHTRKDIIRRHNEKQEEINREMSTTPSSTNRTISNESINSYAKMEQEKMSNGRG